MQKTNQKGVRKMSKTERFMDEQEEMEIDELQSRICYKISRIRCIALLEKLEDMVNRIYRRGSR